VAGVTFEETGSKQLAAAVDGIADGLDDLTAAAATTVHLVVARARQAAPVRTGNLARSIRGDPTGSTATIGTAVSYGLPVHFGVPSHNQRPQPFLFQAVDAEQARIVDAYTDDVQDLIDKEVS
jgi:hypothetical protein